MRFDVVLANPPYIPRDEIPGLAIEVRDFEPESALDGGPDGLDCYRRILADLPGLLAPSGMAFFEVGIGQAADVEALVRAAGLVPAGTMRDLAGVERCVRATK